MTQICEYCLIDQDDTYLACQVDHIISQKHGGKTLAENLAFACAFCNRSKGADVGSIAQAIHEFTRFFNPRVDQWSDHFVLNGARIESRTAVGEVTSRILGFNAIERLAEREALRQIGRFPSPVARTRIGTSGS